jgi:hypothetical protein
MAEEGPSPIACRSKTQMRTIAEFTKTTLIGGFLIVLPVYVSLLLLAKAVQGLLAAVKPITAGIPASVEFREILAILALAAVCFIAGLIVRTGPGLRAKNAVEETLLEKLPGYTLLRASPDARHRSGGRTRLCAGARRDRRGTGSGSDCRETGGRFLYCAGAVGADADGRSDLHPAAWAGASGRRAAYRRAQGVLEMGAGAGDFVRAMQAAKPSQATSSPA